MNKRKNGIKDYFSSPGVRLVVALAVPVIVILVVIMIYMLSRPEVIPMPLLAIDNFGEVLPDVSVDTEVLIEEKLYTQVTESGVSSVPEDGAMIRRGSVDGFAIQDFHVGDFIVDIASVEQSYIVKYYYGELKSEYEAEESASVMVYCVEDENEVIYPDFACKANRDFVKPDPIQYILPQVFEDYSLTYTYSLTSESGYAIVVTYDPPESVYLSGKVEEFENESMGKIREFLTGAGVNPDDYEFVIKYRIVE